MKDMMNEVTPIIRTHLFHGDTTEIDTESDGRRKVEVEARSRRKEGFVFA